MRFLVHELGLEDFAKLGLEITTYYTLKLVLLRNNLLKKTAIKIVGGAVELQLPIH